MPFNNVLHLFHSAAKYRRHFVLLHFISNRNQEQCKRDSLCDTLRSGCLILFWWTTIKDKIKCEWLVFLVEYWWQSMKTNNINSNERVLQSMYKHSILLVRFVCSYLRYLIHCDESFIWVCCACQTSLESIALRMSKHFFWLIDTTTHC